MAKTYVMADIHGEYRKFLKMLDLIEFSDEDLLFILGDMIDRGPEPIELLKDLSMRHNIVCLLGNHEYMALKTLKQIDVEITEENWRSQLTMEVMQGFYDWMRNGGEVTLNQYRKLDQEEKDGIKEFLEDLELYEVVRKGEETYVLVHAGFMNFSSDRPLDDYTAVELVFERPDYSKPYFKKAITVSGHTPTLMIHDKAEIYHSPGHIVLDCGAVYPDGRLACLCLDTKEEFYI